MSAPNLPCIANGHNNTSGLTPLASLNPPLFSRHLGRSVKTEWHSYIGRALNGQRAMKTWGDPFVIWTFGVMYREERLYFGAHYGDLVTVRAFDEDTMAWGDYNATLIQPELGATARRQRKWLAVPYQFIDLVAL